MTGLTHSLTIAQFRRCDADLGLRQDSRLIGSAGEIRVEVGCQSTRRGGSKRGQSPRRETSGED